ncbi:MAG TPA: O-acetyl-ADP-ribose deacetylase [Gemmataceae bacterium]|nr:O-acetyl-ADP-ribose deacetylase [Gemmataceae bacterium]
MTAPISPRMRIVRGDITRLTVDAIVNAANESLLAGGGVCGAIHRAAGPELEVACRALGACPTGKARITKAYGLPAKYVIHTVGPIWQGGTTAEEGLLRSCYRCCLEIAQVFQMRALAFPCISTGIFGYPKERACAVAVSTVAGWLCNHEFPAEVIFCCFGEDDEKLYQAELPREQSERQGLCL